MTNIATAYIDNVDFARKSLKIHGIIDVFNFLRLKDALASDSGQVEVNLQGWVDSFDKPMLELRVRGQLELKCHRCSKGVEFPVDFRYVYQIVTDDLVAMGDEDGDDVDFLESEHQMSLLELVEDELIVSLPIAPTHSPDCEALYTLPKEDLDNPFAVLAKLKKNLNP